jgi:hypothetical protein
MTTTNYVRFEQFARFHAVARESETEVVLICGRWIEPAQVQHRSSAPRALCGACRSKALRPYLIPDWVKGAATV